MRDATYVGPQNGLRTHLLKVAELAVAQLGGHGRLQHAVSASRAAAQMRFAAVASILLLPALIVGFFGQNFEINPWAKFSMSWEVSATALGAIALTQYVYFKKKKWF